MSDRSIFRPQPLVSIIVPIFNAAPYLDQALESLRRQTYDKLEIICLNDGSTDESLDIMQAHAAADARIRVIDKPNEGYGATCNRGMAEAQGAWLSILEPDDWLFPNAIERMVQFAYTAAEATAAAAARQTTQVPSDDSNQPESAPASQAALPDMVKTPYWRVLFADEPRQTLVHCYYKNAQTPTDAIRLPGGWLASGDPAIAACTELMEYHPSIWSALYRTEFLRENQIGFLPIPGAGWADNPFLVETMVAAKRIAYLDEPFYCYREESPRHFAATIENQPSLVFDRWNDGADVLEHSPSPDPRVARAHYRRGLNNRDKAANILGGSNPLVQRETARMFSRMEKELVMEDPQLSPAQKALFAEVRGIRYTPTSAEKVAFRLRALGRQLHNVRTVGLKGARAVAQWR